MNFRKRVTELQSMGAEIVKQGDDLFTKKFREVRVEGKRIEPDERGIPREKPETGFHFFEARPEVFVPVASGGYDIKFAAGATLPISKPLLQTKQTEMYDRLIQLALNNVGYDPVKLGDSLLRVHDLDPEEFKQQAQEPGGEGGEFSEERLQQQLELANQENELMMNGERVPPTAYVSQGHTLIHVEFMNSPTFQEATLDEEVVRNFVAHVQGELMAQQGRAQGQPNGELPAAGGEQRPSFQGQGQQFNPPQQGGNVNNDLSALIPARSQGGASVPQTQ